MTPDKSKLSLGFVFVALTILLTVYGQVIVKWQVSGMGELPPGIVEKITFVFKQYLNPWIISALLAAFLASASWIVAMTQLELSFAYPFMSLAFVLVLILSAAFLGEAFTLNKAIGTGIIIFGLVIIVR